MTDELLQTPYIDQAYIQEWQQAPFQMMGGIEVLDNMREGSETGRSLEHSYLNIRKRILAEPFTKTTVIGTLARSGGSKSSLLQGMYRLLMSDAVIREHERRAGKPFRVVPVPFSLYAEAAKSAAVHEQLPQFAIPSDKAHGTYSAGEYSKISELMSHDIRKHVLSTQGNEASVILLEPSCPTAIPVSGTIYGIDRGLSPLYDLASDERMKDAIDIFAIDLIPGVAEEVVVFREAALQREMTLYQGDVDVVFTDLDESTEGDDVGVRSLPESTQQKVSAFLSLIMASPIAKQRSDAEMDSLIEQLRQRHEIGSRTDRRFFRYIQAALGMPDSHFHYIVNPPLLGMKTLDLDYFIHSLPVRLYPEIVNTK